MPPVPHPTPAPLAGTVLLGRDTRGRALRVSAHPEAGRVVLSLWDVDRCIGTFRMAADDVPDLVRGLTSAAVVVAGGAAPAAAPLADAG